MKDYERKYKQALIRATREFDCAQTDSTKNVIQTIFPELLESEDEKIRKALMQNLKERFGTKGNMGEGLDMPDVLTWLENQGQTFTKKDVDDAYLKGICDAKHENEKQGEQNHAWSEEDGKKINFLINIIRNQIRDSKYSFGYGDNVKYVTKEEIVDMIKSLRPQTTWKPSHEQITVLHDVAAFVDYSVHPNQKDILVNLYLQLKKLREE